MGLGISLNNALSGMQTGQNALEVVSRNVANSGTPGYHRQSYSVLEGSGETSTYARSGGIQRAFNLGLQSYYTRSTSDAGYANVRAEILDRLQTYLGKPGDAGSLDTVFASLQTALQQLSTSPDNYATRATAVQTAQDMATTLNTLTRDVQGLRQETEVKIASNVDQLNEWVNSLVKINGRLGDKDTSEAAHATLMDQRDRLVSQISEVIDVRVDYHPDDSVALMTRSGVGILDVKPSVFEFQSAGGISATQQFDIDSEKNGVGTLIIHTPSGLTLDLVKQNALKSGELAALIELRDNTLVAAQSQLDDIAAGLAQALSTVKTEGTAVTAGASSGLEVDISSIRNGNDLTLNYTVNGVEKSLKVVRVDDTSKLPLDYLDANGARVIGVDFSAGPASVAGAMRNALGPGITVSNTGNIVRVMDDGAANTTTITSLTARSTATGLQNSLGLNLFVDAGNADFTDALDGKGQRRGFAGRIAVNSAVVADNKLLVQYQANGSLGDAARANYMVDNLQTMTFASGQMGASADGFRLGGPVSDLISQTMNYQGNVVSDATGDAETQALTMDALTQRLDDEYGVNVDEEMARLMELQNAYAANARVISVVQELLDRLIQM